MGDRSPRQQEKLEKQRRRAAKAAPTRTNKRAVESPPDASRRDHPLRFRFDKCDLDSEWCPTKISTEDHRELLEFMARMEVCPVKELIPQPLKRADVAGESRNPDAQRRAQDKYPDDHDAIHELHISGAKRLWGLLYGYEFSVIWWDPDHQVFPTKRVWGP